MNLTKNKIFFIIFIFSAIIVGCEKLNVERINKINTVEIKVNSSTVIAKSNLLDIGTNKITEYGHNFYGSQLYTFFPHNADVIKGEFTDTIKELMPGNTYYIRSYFKEENSITYGPVKELLFWPDGIFFHTPVINYLSKSSVKINTGIINIGSMSACDYGLCWDISANPTLSDNKQGFGAISTNKAFDVTLNSLSVRTHYFAKPYLKFLNQFIIYGSPIDIYIPELIISTSGYLVTGSTTATLRGSIDTLGVPAITDYGFCMATLNSNPNVNDTKYSLGTINQTGEFTKALTGLTQGVRYYFRAYAMEDSSIKYGEVMSFQTN